MLQSHPLRKALFPSETNPLRRSQLLRKALLDAIHSLEPGPGVPGSAPDRRLFRVIELRFIEGLNPNEAMSRLGLAKSQFYRDQARAIEMLIEILWALVPPGSANLEQDDPRSQLINAEVERLAPSRESEGIDAPTLANDLRQIIAPLAEEKKVQIGKFDLRILHKKPYERVLLRQTLLIALTSALDLHSLTGIDVYGQEAGRSHNVIIAATIEDLPDCSLRDINDQLEACRLLLDALGGRLDIKSKKDQIIFTLTWLEYRERLLLVIDDNSGMADLFRMYLKGEVWHVTGASGGAKAREILRETHPDLILLDILMPQEDGWELLRAIKTDEASKNIPVIICSVLKQPQIALQLGAAAYVEKPVSQQELLDVISEVVWQETPEI